MNILEISGSVYNTKIKAKSSMMQVNILTNCKVNEYNFPYFKVEINNIKIENHNINDSAKEISDILIKLAAELIDVGQRAEDLSTSYAGLR